MTRTRPYDVPDQWTDTDDVPGPDAQEQAGDDTDRFPRPPLTVRDDEQRRIAIERYDGGIEQLDAMYARFDAASTAQGIPPRQESRRRQWLDSLLEDGLHVVARHEGQVVGHATLVPIEEATAELAIFVAPAYQQSGIGSRLIRALLGHGQAAGIEHVWLSVQRRNRIAVTLYESVGFEKTGGNLELEMERDL